MHTFTALQILDMSIRHIGYFTKYFCFNWIYPDSGNMSEMYVSKTSNLLLVCVWGIDLDWYTALSSSVEQRGFEIPPTQNWIWKPAPQNICWICCLNWLSGFVAVVAGVAGWSPSIAESNPNQNCPVPTREFQIPTTRVSLISLEFQHWRPQQAPEDKIRSSAVKGLWVQ